MAVTEELENQVLAETDKAIPDYSVDTQNDPRFNNIKTEESKQLAEDEQLYGGMIESSDKFYDDQIEASKDWADKQTQLQQEQTDFAIEKIEQQKAETEQDYKKEQSGAYVDWQKQSSQYGANAEKMAGAGLTNTGYSESSQVSMHNTYQNRVATARESYNRAVLNYDNSIKDAMLQNSAVLAEIAYNALQQQLELSLQGFQYKNNLLIELSNKKMQTKQFFADKWQNLLNQINTENALAEDVRQFESNQAWQTEQNQIERDFQASQAELTRKHDKEMLEAKTAKEKELLEFEYKKQMEKLEQQKKNDLELLAAQQSYKGSSGGYSGSGGSYTINTTPSGSGDSGSVEKSSSKSTSGTHTSSSGATHGGNSGSFGSSNYTPTHSDAVDYMVKMGVPKNKASALETINEWSRHPNGKTYEQYVISYVDSCLAQI